jgi:hypothetical protein
MDTFIVTIEEPRAIKGGGGRGEEVEEGRRIQKYYRGTQSNQGTIHILQYEPRAAKTKEKAQSTRHCLV